MYVGRETYSVKSFLLIVILILILFLLFSTVFPYTALINSLKRFVSASLVASFLF